MLLLVVAIAVPALSWSQPFPKLRFEISEAPYEVWGDKVTADQENEIITIQGSVSIRQEDRLLTADTVRIFLQEQYAEAEGNVHMDSPEGTVSGTWAYIDFAKKLGKISEGNIFIRQGNYRLSGDTLEKTGEDTYYALNSSLTTCNGPNPAWSFKGREIELRLDDHATIRGAKFEIKGVPILYTPWFRVSTRVTRQTGLLRPAFGYSERSGASIQAPFFWAISQNSDLTLYPNPLTRRGWKQGVEYRYILNPESKGELNFDYLFDRRKDDDFFDDGFSRTNKNRWWLRTHINHEFPNEIKAKVDIDLVSDQDFLAEFQSGYSGFTATSASYWDTFQRNLEDDTSLFRMTTVSASRNWEKYGVTGGLLYYQGVTGEDLDNQVPQKLPTMFMSAPQNAIPPSPLFYSLNTSFTNFFQEDGSKGQRFDFTPGFNWPIPVGPYASLIPSVQARQAFYYVDADDPDVDNGLVQRLDTVLSVEASTYVSRVFNMPIGSIQKIKHIIKPLALYEYTFADTSGRLPEFEPPDTADTIHRVTYGFENAFVARYKTPGGVGYRDFARIRFLQSYDIKEADRELFGPDDENQPFSNLRGELEFYPWPMVTLLADSTYDIYDSTFQSINAYLRASDYRGDSIQIDYRFSRDLVEQFNARLQARITETLDVVGLIKTSLQNDQNIELGGGFGLTFQCWGVRFLYTDSFDDRSVGVVFSLLGVGDLKGFSFDL